MKKELRYDKVTTYLKLNIPVIIAMTITGVLFNVCIAYSPTFLGKVLDSLKEGKEFKYVTKMALYYLAFVFWVQINRFLKRLFRRRTANKMTLQMRTKAFSNMLISDIAKFNAKTYGDIMNRQLADIRDSAEAFETIIAESYDTGVLLISYYVFMAMKDVTMASICMGCALFSVFISIFLGKIVRKSTREYKAVYSDTKIDNINILQNEVYYRGFGINKNYYNRYEQSVNRLEKKAIKNTIFRTAFEPLYLAIGASGYVVAFYLGGAKVLDGIWTLGVFTGFVTSFTLVRKKCGFVGRINNNVQNGLVAWERCKGYMVTDIIQKELEASSPARLVVENMSFGYDNLFKLENINFNANAGEIISVCGRIRSGKSTLQGALSGVYEYQGSIKLCDYELKDIKDDKLKSFIHIAPGKVEIFNDTLKYNITFGDEGDFNKAIDTACLRDDIDNFPNKENEILSHSLLNISGGQQRRLQIARCVFNSPKLVILDDPFNAIGISMSLEIINNLKNNYPDTIFIILNNQKESVKLSDKVLFLENRTSIFDTYDNMLKHESFRKLIGGETV